MKILFLILATLLTTGCAATHPPLGAAMTHNQNIQAIAPSAEQKENTYIPADVTRQKLARDRYRNDEIEELDLERTSN